MSITQQQLLQILPNAGPVASVFVPVLNAAMVRYQIIGPKRVAAFIAQVGHESGQLRYVKEIWGPTADQARYEGRKDLGNTVTGDGSKYRGRGLIQITGRVNYMTCGEALALDLIMQPELLEKPQHACMSAAWFWASRGLNTLADAGQFDKITQRINGGQNGAADRQALYARALKVLA
ncbi:glycoside hydrolase family 19 protein [Pseudomonas sp. CCI3.1]|uniref:glycoside hydrolase family 19 protein n=1 Tax=Pseudomonas sp. CCI3.1 TaxID=3048618 RepID=UPI002AB55632|nr:MULTISPECIES: glycoside hydrolase family 19 protein [unclassified Pseudomonas]MDY7584357.1 glycoside hydrolase family 19 protein [Pseudomonas sp. CCI3.1]MEB0065551.1 glycoside hydrolase family 19 protein [Pseudomonas sp. CCI3.1]MEB0071159.1 glycoside hydrolase family 19 protein [Pseudomonas sp. CCI1.4]